MAELKVKLSFIDEMSEKLERIATMGDRVCNAWERAQSVMSASLDIAVSGASRLDDSLENSVRSMENIGSVASKTVSETNQLSGSLNYLDNVAETVADCASGLSETLNESGQQAETFGAAMDEAANSTEIIMSSANSAGIAIDSMGNSINDTLSDVDSFSDSMNNIGSSVNEVAAATDNWTKAAQNYDKSALEAVYSTEQLVTMGYKTADAMFNEGSAMSSAVKAANSLNSAWENSISMHNDMTNAFEQSSASMTEYADSGKLSADMLKELESTSKSAEQALNNLEIVTNQAREAENTLDTAMDSYIASVQAGTPDITALEEAQNMAAQAAENLQSAEENAKKAVEDLSKASDEAGKSMDENAKKGVDAFEALADTVIAAKIADTLYDAAKAAYELADAFSEAEKIVVNATGATGDVLRGLESSMMSVYASHSQDLATTAGAIGEINTRMGLTGDALESVSDKFLNYSRITGSDVVGSVQNVTKVMNQWGVDMENVESVLDRLAYAGQISGASVDSLSNTLVTGAASFQEVGLSLDNTIQLPADFELAGINSSTAVTAMRTAVNNFSKDGLDVQNALQSTIREISTMGNTADATARAVDVFGSRAGQQLAAAIRSGTVSINSFTSTLEAADGTLSQTANAAETLGEKWNTSTNKMKAAFTTALQPSIDKISSGMADAVGWIGEFLNKHPMVTSAITAAGTGLGVVAVGIAGVTFATKVAIPAITAFGTSLNVALGPIAWIASGAAILVGGISMISNAFSKAESVVADYNGTMEECANDIRYTEAAYEKAIEIYGEKNSVVKELEENLNTLHAQYDKGGGDMQVYIEQAEKLGQALDEISNSQKQAMEEIDKTETSSLTAVAMLAALSEQSTHTNADLDLMSEYANYLNDTFHCNIEVNYNTGALTSFDPKKLTDIVIEAAENERYQNAMKVLGGSGLQDDYVKATQKANELINRYNELADLVPQVNMLDYEGEWDNTSLNKAMDEVNEALYGNAEKGIEGWMTKLQIATDTIQENGNIVDKTGAFTQNLFNTLDKLALGTDAVTDSTQKYTEALTEEEKGWNAAAEAYEKYSDDINKLCESYEEVYQSAFDSFQGQFGLYDVASNAAEDYEHTINNVQTALDSQLQYWQAYQSNIETMQTFTADKLGVSQQYYDDFMAYIRTGTPEAASLLNDMVDNLQNGNDEAIKKMIDTQGQITDIQKNTATEVADWEIGFTQKMDDIVKKMNDTVTDMNLSDEANTAAFDTINAYAKAIEENGQRAVDAAKIIADQVSRALSSASGSIDFGINSSSPTVKSIEMDAAGTINSSDIFIAGENGPELVVGKAGSTVFPTSETNRIISALSGMDSNNMISNNSYLTNESMTNNQVTEIINNYNSVQSSSYDDSRIIYLLENMNTAINGVIGSIDTRYNAPESNIVVDFSILDDLVSKIQNVGDTYSADYSRNYNTEYGDTVSNYDNSIIEYGDDVRNLSESINNADYSRNIEESISNIDNSRQLDSIYNADYSRHIEGDTAYGDSIRNAVENIVNTDYSRKVNPATYYGDVMRAATSLYSVQNDYSNTNTYRYTNIPQNNAQELYNSTYSTDNNFSNSVFVPGDKNEFEYKEDSDRTIAANSDIRNYSENNEYSESVEKKEITININGEGKVPITVSGNMGKEEVLEMIFEYVRPAFMNVLSEEILEEGHLSYDW